MVNFEAMSHLPHYSKFFFTKILSPAEKQTNKGKKLDISSKKIRQITLASLNKIRLFSCLKPSQGITSDLFIEDCLCKLNSHLMVSSWYLSLCLCGVQFQNYMLLSCLVTKNLHMWRLFMVFKW